MRNTHASMRHAARIGMQLAALVAVFAVAIPLSWGPPQRLRDLAAYNGNVPPSTTPPAVSLYTFGRGEVVFEKFGHGALCLHYQGPPGDVCFNWGVTDFEKPLALAWGFLRGTMRFWVEPADLNETMRFYEWEDRTVWRQLLPTTPEQARRFETLLWGSLAPDKKFYRYDHFLDNCTTRLRDIINEVYGGVLQADADRPDPKDDRTFRKLGTDGLIEFPIIGVAADFFVARPIDVVPSLYQKMFLPDTLRDEVQRRLGVRPELIRERQKPPIPTTGPAGWPYVVLAGVGLAGLLALALWARRLQRVALVISLLPSIALGLAMVAVMMLSDIPSLRTNEVVLMYWPFDVVVLFLAWPNRQRFAKLKLAALAVVAVLAIAGVLRQPLWAPMAFIGVPYVVLAVLGHRSARDGAAGRPQKLGVPVAKGKARA